MYGTNGGSGIGGGGGGKNNRGGRGDDNKNDPGRHHSTPKWAYDADENDMEERAPNQPYETPSQLTLATQDTSVGSTTRASAASRSRTAAASAHLTPFTPLLLRRRPRPVPTTSASTSRPLEAQRLADIAAHDCNVDPNSSSAAPTAPAPAPPPRQQLHVTAAAPRTDEVLRWRRQQVVVLASGSVGTLVGFVVVVLPTPALLLLAAWMALTAAAVLATRRYLTVWWDQQLVRHGLGPYLPDNVYRLLTNESIHSFMTDDTFMLENRHLLLYFLPLPPPALERYVQRLAPRHVQRLHRPGLGHLLGEAAMRIIVGQELYERQFHHRQGASYDASDTMSDVSPASTPRRPTLEVIIERPSSHPSSSTRRRLDQDDGDDYDDSSDLGIDVSADDVIMGAITDDQARRMASVLPLTTSWVDSGSEPVRQASEAGRLLATVTTPASGFSEVTSSPAESALTAPGIPRTRDNNINNGDDLPSAAGATTSDDVLSLAEEYAEEELVLTQAVINAVYDGVWTPLSRYFVSAAEETAGPVTARLVTYGLGVSAVSTVLGLFLGMVGYRRGIYRRPTIMQAYPRENTLYTTIMLGIAGTGFTLLAHWHLNRGKKGRSYFYSQFSRRPSRKG